MKRIREHARRCASFGAVCALLLLAGCGESGVSAPVQPGSITEVAAGARTGVAGQALAEPVRVLVRGTDQQPLAGVPVTFAAAGAGASASPATATTGEDGIAETRWTLSTTAGTNALIAAAGGSVSVTVSATGVPASPASITATSGNGQTAPAGAAVPTAPTVRVADAYGNPVSGVAVIFTVQSGGGTVSDFVRPTSAQGLASVGAWVLGPAAGPQVLLASVDGGGVSSGPVVFTATAVAGGAAAIEAVTATAQDGTVGVAVTTRPSVRVTDAFGNPVSGVAVSFAIAAGGGQLTGATASTNAQGIATVGSWVLGTTAGLNQLNASVAGAGSVQFTARAAAGAPAALAVADGNNQQAQISRAVATPPTVVVRDALGNGVPGVVVSFAATAGGGTVVGARQVTDAAGTAAVGAWFLGATPGANTLQATVSGLPAVSFTATATAGTAVTMLPNSATVQNGTAGELVADPPSVVVRDITGSPVPGVPVAFTVTAGGGTISGAAAVTNQQGEASLVSWRLGPLIVTNTVVATSPGLPSVTFTASPSPGAAASVSAVAGNDGAAVQGTALMPRPTVRVLDANGNRVSGAIVTFAVTNGGGSITGATQATDAAGEATVGSWVLGNGMPNRLTATVAGVGITGNPVVFTAQAAVAIALQSVPTGPLDRDTDFTIAVQLEDPAVAPVSLAGVPLSIAIASGGGTLAGTLTASTNAAGVATFTVRVSGASGARTFTVSGAGLTSVTTAAITFN